MKKLLVVHTLKALRLTLQESNLSETITNGELLALAHEVFRAEQALQRFFSTHVAVTKDTK